MNLPNVIIIGAQKCGTSSLHYYLSCHPDVSMSVQKELNFFMDDDTWQKGLEWYKKQFPGTAKIYGEASPGYTMNPIYSGAPEKMHQVVPHAKLIYLVRDPVERMISHYLDRYKGGNESRSIEEALLDKSPNNQYIAYSQYYRQLSLFLKYYPEDSILVETADNLKKKRRETLRKVFSFLGIDETFYNNDFDQLRNVSDEKMKRQKPRKIVRQLLLDKHSIYPQLKPWMHAFCTQAMQKTIINRIMPGEEIRRPSLSNEVKDTIYQMLGEDLKDLQSKVGITF